MSQSLELKFPVAAILAIISGRPVGQFCHPKGSLLIHGKNKRAPCSCVGVGMFPQLGLERDAPSFLAPIRLGEIVSKIKHPISKYMVSLLVKQYLK